LTCRRALGGTVVTTVMLAILLVFGYRIVRISVTFSERDLLVRNFSRSRRLTRAEVDEVHLGSLTDSPFRGSVWLSMRDGSVLGIDIAGRHLPFGARGRSTVEARHRLLQSWLVDQ